MAISPEIMAVSIKNCHKELRYLQGLLNSGHPDQRGIKAGIADNLLEEVILMQDLGTGVQFEDGASRSEVQPPYYLLEDCFLVATSERMRKGELSHGRDNYKGGGPEFVLETYDHFMAHLIAIREGDETDDHIGAICANAQILCWHWHNKPENFRLLQGEWPSGHGA